MQISVEGFEGYITVVPNAATALVARGNTTVSITEWFGASSAPVDEHARLSVQIVTDILLQLHHILDVVADPVGYAICDGRDHVIFPGAYGRWIHRRVCNGLMTNKTADGCVRYQM